MNNEANNSIFIFKNIKVLNNKYCWYSNNSTFDMVQRVILYDMVILVIMVQCCQQTLTTGCSQWFFLYFKFSFPGPRFIRHNLKSPLNMLATLLSKVIFQARSTASSSHRSQTNLFLNQAELVVPLRIFSPLVSIWMFFIMFFLNLTFHYHSITIDHLIFKLTLVYLSASLLLRNFSIICFYVGCS